MIGCLWVIGLPLVLVLMAYVHPAVTIILFVAVIAYANYYRGKELKKFGKKYGFLQEGNEYTNAVLQLLSVVIKADNNSHESEFGYIEKSLLPYFGEAETKKFVRIIRDNYLKADYSHKALSRYILLNFSLSERVQILHLVCAIATADRVLTRSEMNLIREIAMYLRIPHRTLLIILGLFKFRNEAEERKSRPRIKIPAYSLETAYRILGIGESATVKEIKKAYRRLAVQHHPDKVIHMGPAFQKAAKEKFQKISDAYEYIKKRKGFS